ncbi:Protein of unknown function [Gryllus bimaculatus]|nr:Protein of unknown function [Gryllus bimaculatus]
MGLLYNRTKLMISAMVLPSNYCNMNRGVFTEQCIFVIFFYIALRDIRLQIQKLEGELKNVVERYEWNSAEVIPWNSLKHYEEVECGVHFMMPIPISHQVADLGCPSDSGRGSLESTTTSISHQV